MGLVHRMVTSTWHASCWADAEKYAAESRARAEEARLATIRAIAEEAGLDPAAVSRIARENGTPDPYA